jgi:type I restriction enzyme, S subunit
MLTREMKDSGVEWIGEIPKDWDTRRLKVALYRVKEIVKNYNGENILSLTMNGVVVRDLVNPKGKMPTTFDGYQKINKGNIITCLFDIDVTPRCVGIAYDDGLTSPAYTQFQISKKFDIKFIYYYLLMLDNDKIIVPITKSLRNTIKSEDFLNLKFSFPTKENQIKISNFLTNSINKINNIIFENQQSIDELKRYKQSIITEAVTKGLDSNVEMRKVAADYTDSVPLIWLNAKLKHLCTMESGKNLTAEEISIIGKYPVYGANGIRGFYNQCNYQGEFLTIGRQGALSGNVHYINEEFWATDHALVTKVKNLFSAKFLYYLIQGMNLNQYAFNAAQPGISASFILQLPCYLPKAKQEQQEIASYLDTQTKRIDTLVQEKEKVIQELESYKKSLIYEYVTGKKKCEGV